MRLLLQVGADSAELPGGYGIALLQTLLALAAVCVLAWVVLRWASQRGLGIGGRGARVRVIERVPLDARRTLWLVKVGGKVLLVGAGDGGALSTLAELREDEVPSAEVEAGSPTFVEVLRRASSGQASGGQARSRAASDEARAVAPRDEELERPE